MKRIIFLLLIVVTAFTAAGCFFEDDSKESSSGIESTNPDDYPALDGKSLKAEFKIDGTSVTFINGTVGFIQEQTYSSIAMGGMNLTGNNSSLGAYRDEFYIYIPKKLEEGKTYTMNDAGTGLIYFNSSGYKYESINFDGSTIRPPEADTEGFDLKISVAGKSDDEVWGTFSGHLHRLGFYDASSGYSYLERIKITEGMFKGKISAVLK